MDLGLAGKVALVTGSTQGIGLATARSFLSEGCRTVVTGRDADRLSAISASLARRGGPRQRLLVAGRPH